MPEYKIKTIQSNLIILLLLYAAFIPLSIMNNVKTMYLSKFSLSSTV